ncbi:MAG: guanylate kinase [Armatimonadetes bacterium]|nr:guanylate kinase [Armatimonadota bacterium]
MPKRSGTLFVISGPAGVGKDTLLERVLPQIPGLRKSVSATTRPPLNQLHGEAYFFVSPAEFQQLVAEGALLEQAEVHGHWYGTPAKWVQEQLASGRDVILNIDVQGGLAIREKCTNAFLIFIDPPSLTELEKRLRARGRDTEAEIQRRLQNAEGEIDASREYDFLITNDDLEEAAEDLKAVIESTRADAPGTIVLGV